MPSICCSVAASTAAQTGAFLMGLRVRGETVEEITGAVGAMRAKMLPVIAPPDAIDIVGTGGDGHGTYNVSTLAALIVAGLRRASRQAWQPRRLVPVRRQRCAHRARREDRPRAGCRSNIACRRRVSASWPRPSTMSRCRHVEPDSRRARHAHPFQPAWAARQSGAGQAAIARRLRQGVAGAAGGSAAQPRLRARLAGLRLRRARRSDDYRPDLCDGSGERRDPLVSTSRPKMRA